MAGHDHSIQHISTSENGATVEYLVSGAASRTDRSTKNMDKIPSGSLKFHYPNGGWFRSMFSQLGFSNGAFISAELSSSAGQFNFYDGQGDLKYGFRTLPRTKSATII
uniref:Uncharacterized protein n=1 Tax=Plectus sambesii TaxID=2011161 RepID=A0A914UJH4_9BILA